jgi:transposase
MYVRTRKNKSGSTSVFVVVSKRIKDKKHPRAVVVKSFGSSKDSQKINFLRKEADKFAKEKKYTPFLRINNEADIQSSQVKTIGFKDFYGKLFGRYFADMKLEKVDYQVLQEIALMRIAQPASKLKTAEIASDFNFADLTINKIYKFMDSLTKENIDRIKRHVFYNSKKLLGSEELSVLFYDLTTIYFENNTASELKKVGYSKDGKSQHVQISLALIVTEFGLPIGYEIFPGNTFEGKTLMPFLLKLRKSYDIKNVTIVADSAMLSNTNLSELTKNNFNYIVAARIKNLKLPLTEQLLKTEGYIELNNDIRYKTVNLNDISLIMCHSKKRAKKDTYDRELTLQRLENVLGKSVKDKLRGLLKKPYIKLSKQSTIELDEQKLEESKKFDGYFGFYTNTDIDAKKVISQYRGLWQVEQTFRITKHNLAIRPVYHYKDRRISAHFIICFLALALIRTAEYLLTKNSLQISSEGLHRILEQIKVTQVVSKGQQFNIISDLPKEIYPVYHLLNIPKPKKFTYQQIF